MQLAQRAQSDGARGGLRRIERPRLVEHQRDAALLEKLAFLWRQERSGGVVGARHVGEPRAGADGGEQRGGGVVLEEPGGGARRWGGAMPGCRPRAERREQLGGPGGGRPRVAAGAEGRQG